MEKFEIFNNTKLGRARLVIIDNEPWFILRDIMDILGLAHPTNLIKRLNPKGCNKITVPTNGGNQQGWIINEGNLYKCIARSNKPEALEFENWVTEEVLPTIRKTGKYDINKPKQLTLPKQHSYAIYPEEITKNHVPLKKYYNKVPVMSVVDLAYIMGRSYNTVHYHAGKNKTLIHKNEIASFKKENPMLPTTISHITILYREEVINICKKMKMYEKVKPQILAYFDDSIPEVNIVSEKPQEVDTDQNMKVEKLLQVLPYITDENLKNHVTAEVIRLIDNKILEEYENGRLHMRFIDSTEKIIEVREIAGYRMTVIETDKPIVECMQLGLMIKNISGSKLIVEKIK